MSQLLGDLLTLARADSGQVDLQREPLDVGDLAAEVVSSMSTLAEVRHVQITAEIMPGVIVDADQTRLTQLLLNLVDNAVKYTPHGGAVTVTVGRQDGWAHLDVADTVLGIAAEHLDRIFERFYRVD